MKKYISLIAICFFCASANAQSNKERVYGDNLLSVSPFVGYATPQVSDLGVGFAYERFLNDFISAKLPVNFGLSTNLFQTGLGLKFYPAGHRSAVKYAVGPTLLLTRSTHGASVTRFDSTNNFWFTEQVESPLMQFGFILNNSLNITIQKNIYIGAELGLGLNYLNNYSDNSILNSNNFFIDEDPNVLFLFSIGMGYRF